MLLSLSSIVEWEFLRGQNPPPTRVPESKTESLESDYPLCVGGGTGSLEGRTTHSYLRVCSSTEEGPTEKDKLMDFKDEKEVYSGRGSSEGTRGGLSLVG